MHNGYRPDIAPRSVNDDYIPITVLYIEAFSICILVFNTKLQQLFIRNFSMLNYDSYIRMIEYMSK